MRRKILKWAFAFIATAMFTNSVIGQEISNEIIKEEYDTNATKNIQPSIQNHTSEPLFGSLPSQILIQSGNEGDTIKLTIGKTISEWGEFRETNFALTLSAPFDNNENRGNFITQSGLPNSYTVGGSISMSLVHFDHSTDGLDFPALYQSSVNALRIVCIKELSGTTSLEKEEICDGMTVEQLKTKFPEQSKRIQLNQLSAAIVKQMENRPYASVQLSGEIGEKSTNYRNPDDISTKIDEGHTVFSMSTSLLYVPNLKEPIAFIGGIELTRDYKLPNKEIRCPAGATNQPTSTCFNAAFGPAQRRTETTAFSAIRFASNDPDFPVSAEFRFAIDPSDGDWGIEAPIYLLQDTKGNLNGGIRVGYDSAEDDVFFGVFIGSKFGFLNN